MKKILIIILIAVSCILGNNLCSAGKINLNTATVAELMTLPYVGEEMAKNIIEYREKHKGFKNIEELKAIKGVGKKKYENLKDLVTVEDKKSQ